MTHLIFGIILIAFCCVIYFFSWSSAQKNNLSKALFLVILCGFLLRLYCSSDLYLHDWDEKYHALVAKNLIDSPLQPKLYKNPVCYYDYRYWTSNSIWLEKPPIPLWAMAGSLKIFGFNEISVRIPSLILSTLAIYLTFLIGTFLFNRKIGLAAAFLHSVNGLMIEVASGRISSDHVETFFIFFVELSLLLAILSIRHQNMKGLPILIGVTTGIALLCKWTPGLLVLPVWLGSAIVSGRYSLKTLLSRFLLILIFSQIIFLPWIIYINHAYPQEAKWVLGKFLFAYSESIEGHSAPFWYYLNYCGIIFGEFIFIPILFNVYLWMKKKTDWRIIFLHLWWVIPVVIFSFAATKRHTYLLIAAPAFFVLTAHSIYYFLRLKNHFKYPWLIILVSAFLIILPVRYCIERVKPFEKREMQPQWTIDLKSLKQKIPQSEKTVVFNLEHPVEAMFYNNFTAYSYIPEKHLIGELVQKGYRVFIVDKGMVDKEIRGIPGVKVIDRY